MDLESIAKGVEEGYKIISPYIRKTPLEYSPNLSVEGQNKVYLKLENIQHSGSFKVRGALNKILSLSHEERDKGIITASTGNHGLATAYALQQSNSKGTIFLPNKVSDLKLKKLKKFNVELQFYGDDSGQTEIYAKKKSLEAKKSYVSPYNDPMIISGQGTVALELFQDLSEINHVFITVGGGGLISGMAGYLKSKNPNIRVYGCQPENSPVMHESVKIGNVVEIESKETISDGSAGGMELDTITFPIVQKVVDEFILVSEGEIKTAMKQVFYNHNLVIEGAAGVAIACYLKVKEEIHGNVVVVICGGNITPDLFLEIVS